MHGEISATNEEIRMAAGDFEENVSPYRSNTKRLEKIPGEYMLVPLTEGLSQGEELHFLLRIFSEMPIDLEEVFHDDKSDSISDGIITNAIIHGVSKTVSLKI